MDVKVTKTAGQDEDEGLEEGGGDEDDPFDTRISGPWMKKWPIKHHNRHTEAAGIRPEG